MHKFRITIIFALALLTLALPASAQAHAVLKSSEPADGAQLDAPPTHVMLELSDRITATSAGLQVFDQTGKRIDSGEIEQVNPNTIRREIRGFGDGTYAIAYRVSSSDGHVVTGTTSFSVGDEKPEAASSAGASDAESAADSVAQTPRDTRIAFSIARFVELLALLAVSGAGIMTSLVLTGHRPRFILTGLLVLLVALIAAYILNAALLAGTTLTSGVSAETILATTSTSFAKSIHVRILVTVAMFIPALVLSVNGGAGLSATKRWICALAFVALAAATALTGHATSTEPVLLRISLDALHLVAAALWFGGLVQLLFISNKQAASHVKLQRFSGVVFAAVCVLIVSGCAIALLEFGDNYAGALDTTYGRIVVVKLLLLLGIIPFAWSNMRTFVPALISRPSDSSRLINRYVLRELVLLLAVIAVTAWLIATPPPRVL